MRVSVMIGLGLGLGVGTASADPATDLRDGNAAAIAGDWARVAALTDPLVAPRAAPALPPAELAEAHRLAGVAAYFLQQPAFADAELLAYLRLAPDAHLDPALYPPEVVTHFEDLRARHAGELAAHRAHPRRYFVANLFPPLGQLQNREPTKAWITGGLLLAFAATNVTSYFVLRSWCHDPGNTCDADGTDHRAAALRLRDVNIAAGVGLIATYAWGLYDSIAGYRRVSREQAFELQPFAAPTTTGAMFGVAARF